MADHVHRHGGRFHSVRFYEDDASLCRLVTEFIGDGLAAGQPAVVIAVPRHRDGIIRGLGTLAFDVAQLEERGDLLLLDAEETLATFMKAEAPDPAAFVQSIGGILDRLAAGRPQVTVRAYGEMVDCLWKRSATDAAIRLEVLWNELADARGFSLLCGYAIGNFYKYGAYEDICRQHTHVLSASGQPTPVTVS